MKLDALWDCDPYYFLLVIFVSVIDISAIRMSLFTAWYLMYCPTPGMSCSAFWRSAVSLVTFSKALPPGEEIGLINKSKKLILIFQLSVSEWLLVNANSAILSYIMARKQVNFQWDDDDVRFVLSWICIVQSLWNKSRRTQTQYPDSEPTSLCSFSLMLRA